MKPHIICASDWRIWTFKSLRLLGRLWWGLGERPLTARLDPSGPLLLLPLRIRRVTEAALHLAGRLSKRLPCQADSRDSCSKFLFQPQSLFPFPSGDAGTHATSSQAGTGRTSRHCWKRTDPLCPAFLPSQTARR